jgi:hypothetical protein
MELIPIKVRIGLKKDGGKILHSHPDFNSLSEALRDNLDWSYYVDKFGGWHYDKVAGHSDHEPDNDSPRGEWIGMLLVPENFAQAAVDKFSNQCSFLSEQECERFYEDRCTVEQPEIHDDTETLQAISAKRTAGIPEDDQDENAMNPDHPMRGRRKNKIKKFAGYKKQRGITIKSLK